MAKRKRQRFVAIVDDDPGVRTALEDLLNSNGLRTRTFPSAEAFLQSVDRAEPGCLILDYRLPGMSGLEVMAVLRSDPETRDIPMAVLSNFDEPALVKAADDLGALAFMVKADTTPAEVARAVSGWIRG